MTELVIKSLSRLTFDLCGSSKNWRRPDENRALLRFTRSASVRGRKPESTRDTISWPFRSSILESV